MGLLFASYSEDGIFVKLVDENPLKSPSK